jgi:hypothetical protein
MNAGAGLTSLEALNDWYAALAQFKAEAHNALTSVALALQRANDWLLEKQAQWKREIHRAEDAVAQARAELRTRKLEKWEGHDPDTTVQEKNLQKALSRLEFVEGQLERTRQWIAQLPGVIEDTYDGPARNLTFFLDSDLTRALAVLARQLGALEQYTNLAPAMPASEPPSAPPATGTPS